MMEQFREIRRMDGKQRIYLEWPYRVGFSFGFFFTGYILLTQVSFFFSFFYNIQNFFSVAMININKTKQTNKIAMY